MRAWVRLSTGLNALPSLEFFSVRPGIARRILPEKIILPRFNMLSFSLLGGIGSIDDKRGKYLYNKR